MSKVFVAATAVVASTNAALVKSRVPEGALAADKAEACDRCKTAAKKSCTAYLSYFCYASNTADLDTKSRGYSNDSEGALDAGKGTDNSFGEQSNKSMWVWSIDTAAAGPSYQQCFVTEQTNVDNFGEEIDPNDVDSYYAKCFTAVNSKFATEHPTYSKQEAAAEES